ncbi:hypothetical protein GW17_00056613, partial [Ensete ventricosum]
WQATLRLKVSPMPAMAAAGADKVKREDCQTSDVTTLQKRSRPTAAALQKEVAVKTKKGKSRRSIDLKGHIENDGEEVPFDTNRKQSVEDRVVSRPNGSHGVRWVDQDSTETASGHVEFVAAFAPPRLWVVLGGHRSAGRHSHMHRVARGAVAALARTPWRVRPRSADELPPPSGHRHLQPAGSQVSTNNPGKV